jgi:hypothetical protein
MLSLRQATAGSDDTDVIFILGERVDGQAQGQRELTSSPSIILYIRFVPELFALDFIPRTSLQISIPFDFAGKWDRSVFA